MSPSERLTVIKKIASHLASFDYPDIDLSLETFGIAHSIHSASDKYSYLVVHLKDASDEKLLPLFRYLASDEEMPVSSLTPDVWAHEHFRIFISHSSLDKVQVSALKNILTKYNIDAFVAHDDIEPTAEWLLSIEKALSTCDAAIAFLTENFRNSKWTDQEIGICFNRRILILPIKNEIDPYGFISRFQALKYEEEMGPAIADVLIRHHLTSVAFAKSLLKKLKYSTRYRVVLDILVHLEKFSSWTPDLLTTLEECSREGVVQQSWGASATIEKILQANRS